MRPRPRPAPPHHAGQRDRGARQEAIQLRSVLRRADFPCLIDETAPAPGSEQVTLAGKLRSRLARLDGRRLSRTFRLGRPKRNLWRRSCFGAIFAARSSRTATGLARIRSLEASTGRLPGIEEGHKPLPHAIRRGAYASGFRKKRPHELHRVPKLALLAHHATAGSNGNPDQCVPFVCDSEFCHAVSGGNEPRIRFALHPRPAATWSAPPGRKPEIGATLPFGKPRRLP